MKEGSERSERRWVGREGRLDGPTRFDDWREGAPRTVRVLITPDYQLCASWGRKEKRAHEA